MVVKKALIVMDVAAITMVATVLLVMTIVNTVAVLIPRALITIADVPYVNTLSLRESLELLALYVVIQTILITLVVAQQLSMTIMTVTRVIRSVAPVVDTQICNY